MDETDKIHESERIRSRRKMLNRFDPIYVLLDRIVFKPLFQPPKASKPGEFEKIEIAELDFLVENLNKHRKILWLNIVLVIYLYLHGLDSILSQGHPEIVVTGLLAPAMITGAAWFAVSFGGIPEKFINIAVTLTFAMFLSFTLSMTLLSLLLIKLTPGIIGFGVILPIYLSLYLASMFYDNVDGLKIGLDSTLLKFSRASINFYQKHGLITIQETQQESFGEDTSMSSEKIASFTYSLKTLERNVNQLQDEKGLKIANHLIASSIDLLFNILRITGISTKRDEAYDDFIDHAHAMSQQKVDSSTFEYLKGIIDILKTVIGAEAATEIAKIESRLNLFANTNPSEPGDNGVVEQNFADMIFSQTFRELLELISAYRHLLFNK